MRIGIPAEVIAHEDRVACTPAGVHALVAAGHEVRVEMGAGEGSALSDQEYLAAGALLFEDAAQVWDVDLVCKVKEPVHAEYHLMRPGQIVFTYLHAAANADLTHALLEHRVTSIAYETVRAADGSLPLLAPMSEIAGRLAAQIGAVQLLRPNGGAGILMGGVPGTPPANVVILGGGMVGRNAAQIAIGMRAEVTVVDISPATLRSIDTEFDGRVNTVASNPWEIEPLLLRADLVIGAVLIPGARAPHLVSDAIVSRLKPGAVLVDVAVDQGGCFEVTRPTTHDNPTYRVHDCVVYAVGNMPGAVPVTATRALTNATLPYIAELAAIGSDLDALLAGSHVEPRRAALQAGLRAGLTTADGSMLSVAVAEAHCLPVG